MVDASRLIIDDKEIDNYYSKQGIKEYTKIKTPGSFREDVVKYFTEDLNSGLLLPFSKFDDYWRLRFGEMSIISGFSGHGKTMWLSYVVLHMLSHTKCLIGSFEMTCRATLGRMIMQTNNHSPTEKYIDEMMSKWEGQLFLYDAEGETSPEKVLSVILYGAEKLGIKIFVIDSLMKVGIPEDDYNAQKKFCNQLAVLSRDKDIHIFLVAHSRKTANELEAPEKFDVMGSSNITNLADNSISVFRNKQKEIDLLHADTDHEELRLKPDCTINVNKQRHGDGWNGQIGLYFDAKTFRYSDRPF